MQKYQLRLNVEELLVLQQEILKRPPTLAECVLWSIQGSEHCSYKSSKIHLEKMPTEAPHVLLGPKEDAGIIAIAQDKTGLKYGLVVSHESHNHPSQLLPYEGAATGVGGNVRDVSCMGAEVIALGNGLRFGEINCPHSRMIQQGVVAGIAGYANPIGVPTIAGDVYYHAGYNDNCLVTIVTLGLVKEDAIIHSHVSQPIEDAVFILIGKPTDGSGFAGAAFASQSLADNKQNRSAIQEPNAFLKNHLLQANNSLFKRLKGLGCLSQVGFKDLGAGGIACASIEMAAASNMGAVIYLDKVPTLQGYLAPEILLCSETQERFLWLVPKTLEPLILTHYNEDYALGEIAYGAEAKTIGKLTKNGLYQVVYKNALLVNVAPKAMTAGFIYQRPYYQPNKALNEPRIEEPTDYNSLLLSLLAHEHIASRTPIFEQYDKQVQGRTVLAAGDADAGLIQPFNDLSYPEEIRNTGVALSLDQCPGYNLIDPYWGAVNAVIEAARNVVAVGATPLALTDCLCFGNPEKPEHFWAFAEAVRGIVDACQAIGLKEDKNQPLPIISGNVSFYNESSHSVIPPSPMIACIGTIADVKKAITLDFKQKNSLILLVGERRDECGGGVFYAHHQQLGAHCPQPNLTTIGQELRALQALIDQDLILAAHDIADGGLAIALAEMSFKNSIGIVVEIPGDLVFSKKLFSETGGFILEIRDTDFLVVQQCFASYECPFLLIGKTQELPYLEIKPAIHLALAQAKEQWQNGLRDKL
ncbi:phosphoribosylformylglycinamidine synthase subunit PurL [Legionella sp. km772]|nr:phosphoribosylformylglycinamidine synthase subunit PurL [Legionella sp. km772]